LKAIVDAHYALRKETEPPTAALADAASERFLKVRGKGDIYNKPSTSEFLDWLEALRGFRDLAGVVESLRRDDAKLLYPELLFKIRDDWWRHAAEA